MNWILSSLKFLSSMFHQTLKHFSVFNRGKNLHHNNFSQLSIYSRNWWHNNYKGVLIFQFQVSRFSSYGSFVVVGALIFTDNLKIQCCLSNVVIDDNSIITIDFVPFSLLKCYVNGSKWPLMIAKCYGMFFHNPFSTSIMDKYPQCNHEIMCRKQTFCSLMNIFAMNTIKHNILKSNIKAWSKYKMPNIHHKHTILC